MPEVEVDANSQLHSSAILLTEEFLHTGVEGLPVWQTSEDGSSTRANLTLITMYGCSSQIGGGNYKYYIPNEISNALRIPRGVYIAENVTCNMEVKIDGLGVTKFITTLSSPLCGIIPGSGNFNRGYTVSSPDAEGKMIFTTLLIHIKSDLAGINYDMWYPCKPADIQWLYNLIE